VGAAVGLGGVGGVGVMLSAPSAAWAQEGGAGAASATTPDAKADAASKYVRVVEEDGGKTLKLEIASRRLEPVGGKGPTVFLTGAVHIGDPSFYESLQAFLDAKDVVLFEGVKPPGAGSMEHGQFEEGDDSQRVTATKRRIQLLALFFEKYKAEKGEYPITTTDLEKGLPPKLAKMGAGLERDAWGNWLIFSQATRTEEPAVGSPKPEVAAKKVETSFDITSLGSDGKEGGEGDAADIKYSNQTPVKASDLNENEEGIQAQMAHALGLVFQLDAMDPNKPNWRNSDLSIDQIQDRLAIEGADADELFSMLSGNSFMAKVGGFVLKLIGGMPSLSTMLKMMMVDMLASADDLMANMPGNMGAMMDVIIKDRNEVVVHDLAALIKNEPDVKTVAIIYGAGHLPDMEERIVNELGYRDAGEQWFTAITVDVTKTGMSVKEASRMRGTMKKMLQMQMKKQGK